MIPKIRTLKQISSLLALAICFVLAESPASAQSPAEPTVTKLAPGVYQHHHLFYTQLIVVTKRGVVVTDPSGEARAQALFESVRSLTDKRVRLVVYSHDHYDHARGGQVFAAGNARFISHQKCLTLLNNDPLDQVVPPDRTYRGNHRRLHMGGKKIDLYQLGPSDGECMTVVHLPREGVLLLTDIHVPQALTSNAFLTTHNYKGVYNTLTWIRDNLEYKHVISAHAAESSPAAFNENVEFVEKLHDEVLAGLKAGLSVDELMAKLDFSEFSHWSNFDQEFPFHVARMYFSLNHGG